jgi:hypothetical protein
MLKELTSICKSYNSYANIQSDVIGPARPLFIKCDVLFFTACNLEFLSYMQHLCIVLYTIVYNYPNPNTLIFELDLICVH